MKLARLNQVLGSKCEFSELGNSLIVIDIMEVTEDKTATNGCKSIV